MSRYRYNNWYTEYLTPPPLQLCFIFMVLIFLLGFSWYVNYESMFEDFMFQLKLILIMFPVVLLLVVHCLSGAEERSPFAVPLPDQDSIHRAGGSPWGVGILLIFLMFMISYRTSIHECWFPLIAGRGMLFFGLFWGLVW